ncbi:MAG: adenylosuccinate lyase [Candidatus Caenarcaniphilales bacterium]|nr:adenylosuccinate lyase [Candidatus Caenarcaniphilales bacterium]
MIERYTTPEMNDLWSEDNKFKIWQKVEIAVCKAWNKLDKIPSEDLKRIEASTSIDPKRVYEIDAQVHHDVIAFLTAWNEQESLQSSGRFIHLGLTSSDLIDTALSLMLSETSQVLLTALDKLLETSKKLAYEHKNTLTIGRTHGVHGEPSTFGLKIANFYADLQRAKEKLKWASEAIRVGMFSGPVGTYSNLNPQVEQLACQELGLQVVSISTQVISRERHADFVYALASLGSIIEKIATELRHLQRTEVLEVEEPFYSGQKGSSSMPHKRNPWRSENLCGLARMLRGYIITALENIALWHERDISHSSTERIYFPDMANLAHFMILRLTAILADLRVYPENMKKNLFLFGGVVHSQKVLINLVEKGMSREDAYKIVQNNAHKAWNKESGDFKRELKQDPEVQKLFSEQEINQSFEIESDLKYVDEVFERVFS